MAAEDNKPQEETTPKPEETQEETKPEEAKEEKKEPSRRFGRKSTANEVLEGIDLTDKTILITGANNGIGYESARTLAGHGAHVVMACRNLEAAEEAKKKIIEEFAEAKIDILKFDAADLATVKECADAFQAKGWPLHTLILNAGVYNPPEPKTKDNLDSTFQINHLGHFLLTMLLKPQLIAAAPARVVVLSSMAHLQSLMNATDCVATRLSPEHSERAGKSYAKSKLCNVLFAFELDRRLKDKNVRAFAVHPGVVRTNIAHNSSFLRFIFTGLKGAMSIDVSRGAATSVYVATAPELEGEGGAYYSACKKGLLSPIAKKPAVAEALWQTSEEMLAERGYEFEKVAAIPAPPKEVKTKKVRSFKKEKIVVAEKNGTEKNGGGDMNGSEKTPEKNGKSDAAEKKVEEPAVEAPKEVEAAA